MLTVTSTDASSRVKIRDKETYGSKFSTLSASRLSKHDAAARHRSHDPGGHVDDGGHSSGREREARRSSSIFRSMRRGVSRCVGSTVTCRGGEADRVDDDGMSGLYDGSVHIGVLTAGK